MGRPDAADSRQRGYSSAAAATLPSVESEPEVPASERPSTRALLALQRAETSVVRAGLAVPDAPEAALRRLRYLLGYCRLTTFQPGAAGHGRSPSRPEVTVADEVEPLRMRVVAELCEPLSRESEPARKLQIALDGLERLAPDLRTMRQALLEHHANDFSAAELDAECGQKHLVLAAGGGGEHRLGLRRCRAKTGPGGRPAVLHPRHVDGRADRADHEPHADAELG